MSSVLDDIRKADKEADKMLEEFEKGTTSQTPPATKVEEEAAPAKELESKAAAAPEKKESSLAEEASRALTSEPLAGPKYDQMYKTLKGKYDAEVPRLHKQLLELSKQLEDFKAKDAKAVSAEMTPDRAKELLKGSLSKEELDGMGDDALVLYAKIADGVARKVGEESTKRLEKELANVQEELANSRVADIWDEVEHEVPGARDINSNDPGWIEFLEGVEPSSGLSYFEIGERAVSRGDSKRLVALLNKYKGKHVTSKEIVSEEPVVKPDQSASKAASDVDTSSKSSKGATVIKESDIPAFYNSVRKGEYAGRENERKIREKEIEAAVYAGRVVAG